MMPPHSIGSDRFLRNGVLLLVALVATVFPFWTVSVPPATDLPQHLSQIFLLEETLAGRRPELMLTPWYFPNTLIYGLIYGFWQISDPLTAGRLTMSALMAAWVLAGYALAKFRDRPVENWLIGVPLAFNFLFYWGLLNFLLGWPLFCLFVVVATRDPSSRQTMAMAGTALLLYYAHALWFLMANVWLLARFIDRQPGSWRLSLAAVLPGWLLALIWYPQLATARAASGVDIGLDWGRMPLKRLALDYFTGAAQGGMYVGLETAFVLLLSGWIALVIVTRWRYVEAGTDKPLFVAAMVFVLAYWMLPWNYMNTIFFSQRWLPCGLTLLLLALPAPRVPRLYCFTAGITLLLLFSLATIKSWRDWQEEQMGGFLEAIGKLEKSDRVFGVDMFGGSMYIRGRPGLQLSSYAQALRGCDTNFTFTDHRTGIVQYVDKRHVNPIRRLVSSPYLTKPEHLRGFDRALVNGDPSLHDFFRTRLNLEPLDDSQQTWRVYRIPPR